MDTFEYDGNLARLAYEESSEYVKLLKPYYKMRVHDFDGLLAVNEVQRRLNSDHFVVNVGSFGSLERDLYALDILLASADVNEEALLMTLALGADPKLSLDAGLPGLILQTGYGNLLAVDRVACCAGLSFVPSTVVYEDIVDPENAGRVEQLLTKRLTYFGSRPLATLLLYGDVYAIFNRMRRHQISLGDLMVKDKAGKDFLELTSILPELPALYGEMSLRLEYDIRQHTAMPWERPSGSSSSGVQVEAQEVPDHLSARIATWARACCYRVQPLLFEKAAQHGALEKLSKALDELDKEDQQTQGGDNSVSSTGSENPLMGRGSNKET